MLDYTNQAEKPLYQLPTRFHELIFNSLLENERIIWAAQPEIERATRITRRILIKFSVVWLVIWVSIILFLRVLKIDDDGFSLVIGIAAQTLLFLLALFAKTLVKSKAPQIAYILTNQRFLTVDFGSDTPIVAFGRDKIRLAKQKLRDEGQGYGSLSYGWGIYKDSEGTSVNTKIGFFHVPQIRQLEELIQANFGPQPASNQIEWPRPE